MSGAEPLVARVRGGATGGAFPAFLLLTAALSGALVMVVEVLGSRVIGPLFGVSLFVWTALITVTLLALAAGYALGGYLADRYPSPSVLYGLIGAAGLLVAAVPLLRAPVLKAALPAGLRAGALLGSLVLFGPALLLLGCVSPYVIRLGARGWERLGRTVGTFYAVSTAGSFAGTVATGFYLVAKVGVSRAFFACGAILVVLAAAWFVLFRRRWAAAGALALLVPLFPTPSFPVAVRQDGTRVEIMASRDGFYGNVKVVDYSFGTARIREMAIDGFVQGGVDLKSRLPIYEYAYLLEYLPRALRPEGRRCLVIGLGGGIIPTWYQAEGVETDVVEIDSNVVDLAERYFDFRSLGTVWVEDARTFFSRGGELYDYIVLDAFNGDAVPGHLLSREALLAVKSRLHPRGVVSINLIGSLGAGGSTTASVIATFREVFGSVSVYPLFDAEQAAPAGNLVLVAADGETLVMDALEGRTMHRLAADRVRFALRHAFEAHGPTSAPPITDDFNFLDVRDIGLKEMVRRNVLETTPIEILLGG